MSKGQITTHVLDTANGRPAAGVPVTLFYRLAADDEFVLVGSGTTNEDGRATDLLASDAPVRAGIYRLEFDLGSTFPNASFWTIVPIIFSVDDPSQHYHVPLLVSPYGYSTYRGS